MLRKNSRRIDRKLLPVVILGRVYSKGLHFLLYIFLLFELLQYDYKPVMIKKDNKDF